MVTKTATRRYLTLDGGFLHVPTGGLTAAQKPVRGAKIGRGLPAVMVIKFHQMGTSKSMSK